MLTCRLLDDSDTIIAELGWLEASTRHELMREGGWEVVAPGDRRLVNLLKAQDEQWWMVMVDHSTQFVHGGVLWDWRFKKGKNGAADTVTMWGGDGNWYLNTSCTLPESGTLNYDTPPPTDRTYSKTSQQASVSLYELVDDQLNDTSPSYRQRDVSLTAAASTTVGSTLALECSSPFEPLLDTVREWSLAGGIVTDFPLDGASSTVEMLMRAPVERGFRLSDQNGVMVDWEYRATGHKASVIYPGGAGEGVDRLITQVVGSNQDRWGTPIERFVKASSAATITEANAAGLNAVADNEATTGLRTRALASRMGVEFGTDYNLGDIVSVEFMGTEYRQLITAVEIGWSPAGKEEQIETGEPDLSGASLGEVTAAAAGAPTAGLSAGYLQPTGQYDPVEGGFVALVFQIVYAAGEPDLVDQATWEIERRVDFGAWSSVTSAVATGSADLFYATVTTSNLTFPAFTESVEYRAKLAKSGETTVYSSRFQIGAPVVLGGDFSSTVTQTQGNSNTYRTVIPDAYPSATNMNIQRSAAGSGVWVDDPGSGDSTLGATYGVGGPVDGADWTFSRSVTHDAGGDFVYRFQLTLPSGQVFTSAETSTITVTPTVTPSDTRTTTTGDTRTTTTGDTRTTS